jgi:hypothetical protein
VARFTFAVESFTPTAVADGTTFTNGAYMGLAGGNTTQVLQVNRIYQAGLSTASALQENVFARDSTAVTTPTALVAGSGNSNGPHVGAATATAGSAFIAGGTNPQRSNSISQVRLPLSFNGYGGISNWQASPGEEWWIIGNAANQESSLSGFTGSTAGPQSTSITYEAF